MNDAKILKFPDVSDIKMGPKPSSKIVHHQVDTKKPPLIRPFSYTPEGGMKSLDDPPQRHDQLPLIHSYKKADINRCGAVPRRSALAWFLETTATGKKYKGPDEPYLYDGKFVVFKDSDYYDIHSYWWAIDYPSVTERDLDVGGVLWCVDSHGTLFIIMSSNPRLKVTQRNAVEQILVKARPYHHIHLFALKRRANGTFIWSMPKWELQGTSASEISF